MKLLIDVKCLRIDSRNRILFAARPHSGVDFNIAFPLSHNYLVMHHAFEIADQDTLDARAILFALVFSFCSDES